MNVILYKYLSEKLHVDLENQKLVHKNVKCISNVYSQIWQTFNLFFNWKKKLINFFLMFFNLWEKIKYKFWNLGEKNCNCNFRILLKEKLLNSEFINQKVVWTFLSEKKLLFKRLKRNSKYTELVARGPLVAAACTRSLRFYFIRLK